jgi:hypothetical protein
MKEKHPVEDCVTVMLTLPTELMIVSVFLLDISGKALFHVVLTHLSQHTVLENLKKCEYYNNIKEVA